MCLPATGSVRQVPACVENLVVFIAKLFALGTFVDLSSPGISPLPFPQISYVHPLEICVGICWALRKNISVCVRFFRNFVNSWIINVTIKIYDL